MRVRLPRIIRHVVLLAFFIGIASPTYAISGSNSALEKKLKRTIQRYKKRLPKSAKIQVAIRDLNSGNVLAAYGGDKPLNLASVTKIITAAAVLDYRKPDFRFSTRVLAVPCRNPDRECRRAQGDTTTDAHLHSITLVPGGDPTLKGSDLGTLAKDIYKKGVRSADTIQLVTTPFGPTQFPPGFKKKNTHASYRAPAGSMNIDRNSVRIQVYPDKKIGRKPAVYLKPKARFPITNRAKTVAGRGEALTVRVVWGPGNAPTIEVGGTIGVRRTAGITAVRLNEHPEKWAAETFRLKVSGEKIRVGRKVNIQDAPPAGAIEIASHQSAPLSVIVKRMLQYSDNQIAEAMLLWMAKDSSRGFEGGAEHIREWLELLGCSAQKLYTYNGSGLYNGGFGSALEMTHLLVQLQKNTELGKELQDSLAGPGIPGTLRGRMAKLPRGVRVRAKTGTLNEVSALCGYILRDSGGQSFCVLLNDINRQTVGVSRRLQDAVVQMIAVANPKSTVQNTAEPTEKNLESVLKEAETK
ncbi:MAG: D-alanyl-D-alanine carboxypeptidase/D-alanyl-D-alanine-endopeptidase [Myxococcales bacterium]|mgnify:CR=1 FL=1|nr:D-alanyl-D-alanine carboxypeptidase/D-alanyl-D-alanine-endopeptidase [Myxococcales bacterium]